MHDNLHDKFLFSVDLEDLRFRVPNGVDFMPNNLVELVDQVLLFLKRHAAQATFFVVGDVAENFPDLIRRLHAEGHEIAWHSHRHTPLIKQTPREFEQELETSRAVFQKLGVEKFLGFRAPYFSMTEATQWVYPILQKHGFKYSSSVLAAKRQLYGWHEFGAAAKKVGDLWEVPMTVADLGVTSIPFAGGAYLRSLPLPLLKLLAKRVARQNLPLQTYIHPYDLDVSKSLDTFPDAHLGKVTNFFLRYNRENLIPRLEILAKGKKTILPYTNYVDSLARL